MKFGILRVLFSLGVVGKITLTKDIQILNNHDSGVVCGPTYSIGEGTKISFHVEDLTIGEGAEIEEIKVPFALLRYTDTAFYDNFPDIRFYNDSYQFSTKTRSMYNGLVDFESNRFNLERNNISVKGVLDEPIIRTGYLGYKMNRIEFSIDKSGYYCVVIAPPVDKGINILTIPVNYEGAFNLTLQDYKVYYNLNVSLIVGFFITAILCFALKSLKNDNQSIIPISIIKNILIPILFIQAITIAPLVVEKYTQLEKTKNIFKCLSSIVNWINMCIKVTVTYYFPLLFSMGVGIIYLIKDTNAQLRSLPYLIYGKAKKLLYLHILLSTVCSNEENFKFAEYEVTHLVFLLLQLLNKTMWIVWIPYTLYYYFITKRSITKFPAYEELGESKKVTNSFRNSLLVIYLTRLLISLIEIIYRLVVSTLSAISNLKLFEKELHDSFKIHSIPKLLVKEKAMNSIFAWSETYFNEYIIIVFLFFIWFDYRGLLEVTRS